MRIFRYLALFLLLVPAVADAAPIVIAHRGASGYLPEHTLEAYRMAIEQGADYIEPDLVMTRDGVLIARHDIYLGTTTDVASLPAFADRRREFRGRDDWFVADFTLAEIRQLRARQPFEGRSTAHDDEFAIPTFQEVIDLVRRHEQETGRRVGLYPETKDPEFFDSQGHDFARTLVDVLETNGLTDAGARVLIQSFEPGILRRLDQMVNLPLVMLVTPVSRDEPHTPNIPLGEIVGFADGIGAMKWLLIKPDGTSSGVIEAAKENGLFVHAWTFRDDQVPAPLFDSAVNEIQGFLELGVDGFFTDFPDTGVRARDASMVE